MTTECTESELNSKMFRNHKPGPLYIFRRTIIHQFCFATGGCKLAKIVAKSTLNLKPTHSITTAIRDNRTPTQGSGPLATSAPRKKFHVPRIDVAFSFSARRWENHAHTCSSLDYYHGGCTTARLISVDATLQLEVQENCFEAIHYFGNVVLALV